MAQAIDPVAHPVRRGHSDAFANMACVAEVTSLLAFLHEAGAVRAPTDRLRACTRTIYWVGVSALLSRGVLEWGKQPVATLMRVLSKHQGLRALGVGGRRISVLYDDDLAVLRQSVQVGVEAFL